MDRLQRVNPIRISKLNNHEYVFFMQNVINLAKEATAEHLGIRPELIMQLESDISNIIINMNTSRVASQTGRLQKLDGQRDEVIRYIFGAIRTNTKSFLSTQKEAAKLLQSTCKPYQQMTILPLAQQSVQIQSLLAMLQDGECFTAISALGLEDALAHLKNLNNEYIELYNERTDQKSSTSCRPFRESADLIYDTISLMAQSMALVGRHSSSITFVATLNKRIAETEAAYNQRKADEVSDLDDAPVVFPSTKLPEGRVLTTEDRIVDSLINYDEIELVQRE